MMPENLPLLMPQSTIGVIAPSRPLNSITQDNIRIGIRNLERLGYKVKFGKWVNLPLCHKDSARLRALDFMDMLADDSVQCILFAIGGYNSNEILPFLDYEKIARYSKPMIGFSDITAVLNAINKNSGIVTFLGPTFAIFCQENLPDITAESFQHMIGPRSLFAIPNPTVYADDLWFLHNDGVRNWKPARGWKCYHSRPFSAQIVGGNLETLLALAGTPYFPETSGKVLILEEANGKPPLQIRRELVQLRDMGILSGVSALAFGRFWGWSQDEEAEFWDEMAETILQDIQTPLLTNLCFGHTDPIITIPIGGTMLFDEKVVWISR